MRALSILALLIFICEIKTIEYECENYIPKSNIDECLAKETGYPHYGCCGLSITSFGNYKRNLCLSVPNTKAGKDFYKSAQELSTEQAGSKLEMVCPENDDKIKGTCEEFVGIMVNDPKECTKLKAKGRKSCCGLKARGKYNGQGVSFEKPIYTCLELPPSKQLRDSTIEEMKSKANEYYSIDGYVC